MKNKTLFFSMIFFFIIGVYRNWTFPIKIIVIIDAIIVLILIGKEFVEVLKNGNNFNSLKK